MPPTTGGSTSGSKMSGRAIRTAWLSLRASTNAIGTPRSRHSTVLAVAVRRLNVSAVTDDSLPTSARKCGQSTLTATATRGVTTNRAPTAAGRYSQRGNPADGSVRPAAPGFTSQTLWHFGHDAGRRPRAVFIPWLLSSNIAGVRRRTRQEVRAMEVLVTGGDTDLGRTIAAGFRDAGHPVVIAGARRDDLEVAAKELDVDAIVFDNTAPASLEEARPRFPHHLDTIVNVPAPRWGGGDPRTYSLAELATAWRA